VPNCPVGDYLLEWLWVLFLLCSNLCRVVLRVVSGDDLSSLLLAALMALERLQRILVLLGGPGPRLDPQVDLSSLLQAHEKISRARRPKGTRVSTTA